MGRAAPAIFGAILTLNLGVTSVVLVELRSLDRALQALSAAQRAGRMAHPVEASRADALPLAALPLREPEADRVAERVLEQVREATRPVDPDAQRLARIEEIAAREEEAIARAEVLVQPMLGRATTAEEWGALGKALDGLEPPELREETIRRILVRLNNRELIAPPGLNPVEMLEGPR